MDEALQARTAAREAIEDITPTRLRDVMDERLAETSMTPGVLAILSGRVVDGAVDADAIARRAAGVQLIYEGLRLTRTLVAAEPWASDPGAPGPDVATAEESPADWNAPGAPAPTGSVADDLDVLAADVLVSRGFRLLARTEAAERAVETVREFGREQTDRQVGRATTARSLEANVFELAAIAGASATGNETPLALRQYVVGLARSRAERPLPPAAEGLPEAVEEVMGRVGQTPTGDEPMRPQSATDR